MKEEQVRILKTMSEATTRMDLNMFAQAVNMNPNQAIALMQELAKEGFLQKVGNGYRLSGKSKSALKVYSQVSGELSFHFYVGVNEPLGFLAQSLEQFYRLIRDVRSDSLEFHLYRGDFERWLRDVLEDGELAEAIGSLKATPLKGEDLRKEILKALDAKYGIGELL